MDPFGIFLWPFGIVLAIVLGLVWLVLVAFWIWMIVDCAKRKFRNDVEKIVWILVLIFTTLLGAVVYYIVVRALNPKGLAKN